MGKEKTINSIVERVSITQFTKSLKPAAKDYFTPRELKNLNCCADQTWAGFFAVKRALIRLFNSIIELENAQITELSFELRHDTNGAPIISEFPDHVKESSNFTRSNFHISITHNRHNAIGLASFQR